MMADHCNCPTSEHTDECKARTAAIRVWRFAEAPEEYRKLSDSGGDEDWLALIPSKEAAQWFVLWLERGAVQDYRGVRGIQWVDLKNGERVAIGSHS